MDSPLQFMGNFEWNPHSVLLLLPLPLTIACISSFHFCCSQFSFTCIRIPDRRTIGSQSLLGLRFAVIASICSSNLHYIHHLLHRSDRFMARAQRGKMLIILLFECRRNKITQFAWMQWPGGRVYSEGKWVFAIKFCLLCTAMCFQYSHT